MVKDIWCYVSEADTARATLNALTAGTDTFPLGHEAFFVCAPDTGYHLPTTELVKKNYPGVPIRGELVGNQGLYDCSKAGRMLGWKCQDCYPWKG